MVARLDHDKKSCRQKKIALSVQPGFTFHPPRFKVKISNCLSSRGQEHHSPIHLDKIIRKGHINLTNPAFLYIVLALEIHIKSNGVLSLEGGSNMPNKKSLYIQADFAYILMFSYIYIRNLIWQDEVITAAIK